MSQVAKVLGFKVTGQVFLGLARALDSSVPAHDGDREALWSADGREVARWMSDGWRTRFNQHRSTRKKYVYGFGDQAGADAQGRVLIPVGKSVTDITDRQARASFPHLAALPAMVLQSPGRVEATEWFAAAKRRKTNAGSRRRAGRMPGFQSRKRSDHRFVCWFNGGSNAVYQRTGRRSGIVTIRGMNPTPAPDGTRRWALKIRVRHTQPIREYTSVQVNLTRGQVTFTSPVPPRAHVFNGEVTGVDVGVANTVALEDGRFLSLPDLTPAYTEVARHQKRLAKSRRVAEREGRDPRRSNRYQAHRRAAAKAAAARVADIRRDWAHKTANALVSQYDIIGIENLNLKGMTRKGRGKRGLNRGMENAALGQLREFLEYKGTAAGIAVVAVPAPYTSQRCRPCGHIARENRESQAVFSCVACGHRAHADTNAAGNILDAALAALTPVSGVRARTSTAGSVNKTTQAQAERARTKNRTHPTRLSASSGKSEGSPSPTCSRANGNPRP